MKNKPYFDQPFANFWYDEQFVTYITNTMAVFSELYVKIGKNDFDSQSSLVKVPVRYGGADRVVDAIIAGNTQNVPLRLPVISIKLADVQPDRSRAKGTGTTERRVFKTRGGSLPDDLTVMHRRTANPYEFFFEVNFFVSNELQKFQLQEQILTIFDPSIQIQTSDDPFDGTKIYNLDLVSVNFEENYPAGTDKKIIQFSMIMSAHGWLQVPLDFRLDYIKRVMLKVTKLDQNDSYFEQIEAEINRPADEDGYETIIDVDKMDDLPRE